MYARRLKWLHSTVTVGTAGAEPVAGAWGSWLGSYPWDSWGTLTFAAGEFSSDAASRAWGRFAAQLPPLATWFVGHEVGARGRLHLHCLLGVLGRAKDENHLDLWQWWFKRYGRAHLAGYNEKRGAAAYVAKYVTKELAHYDLELGGFTCLSQIVPRQRHAGGSWLRKRSGAG